MIYFIRSEGRMGLIVTLELPPYVERKLRLETPDLELDVRQTYALDLFRRGPSPALLRAVGRT
jgi:hypothetical protein